MIQKIRSYLLDNEDNKDSIGWYVVIIMLFPVVGMIFQYRKSIVTYIGTVNNKKIERSIFHVRLFEQTKLIENINKMFGNDQGKYFFDMLFQGKSVEEFVLAGEIKRIFLQSKFEKLISEDYISREYIMSNLKNKSLDKIKMNIGELPFLLVTGQIKPNDLGNLNVDMNKIDFYCQEVFQVNLLTNIFFAPLSIIEKMSFCNHPMLPLKINFITYSFSKSEINEYKKKIELNTISDNEMKFEYDLSIKEGGFQKPRSLRFNFLSYSIKDKKYKKSKDKERVELVEIEKIIKDKWEKIKDTAKEDYELVLKLLEDEFLSEASNKDVSIVFNSSSSAMESSVVISDLLKKQIVNYVLGKENEEGLNKSNFFVLIAEGRLYLIDNFSLSAIEYLSFDDSKERLKEIIIEKRSLGLIKEDMESIRYALEAKELLSGYYSHWKKKESVFVKDFDSNQGEGYDRAFYDLIQKKIFSGGLRTGNTFLEFGDDFYRIYYVSDITYEIDNKAKDNYVIRKDQLNSKDFFIDSLELHAKIVMRD